MAIGKSRHKIKPLSREEELDLIRRWTEIKDPIALDLLLKNFEPLLLKTAANAHKKHPQAETDDYLQALRMKFIHCLDTFNPALGYRLSTHLLAHMIATVQVQAHKESLNHVPLDSTSKRIKAALIAHMAKHPEIHTPYMRIFRDAANDAGVTKEDVEKYYLRSRELSSLDRPLIPEGEQTFLDIMEDNSSIDADSFVSRKEISIVLEEGLSTLSERKQIILRGRFGLSSQDEEGDTLQELGDIFHITTQRVHQIEVEGLRELRDYLENRGVDKDAIVSILSL